MGMAQQTTRGVDLCLTMADDDVCRKEVAPCEGNGLVRCSEGGMG